MKSTGQLGDLLVWARGAYLYTTANTIPRPWFMGSANFTLFVIFFFLLLASENPSDRTGFPRHDDIPSLEYHGF